jgi:hypothetical protein
MNVELPNCEWSCRVCQQCSCEGSCDTVHAHTQRSVSYNVPNEKSRVIFVSISFRFQFIGGNDERLPCDRFEGLSCLRVQRNLMRALVLVSAPANRFAETEDRYRGRSLVSDFPRSGSGRTEGVPTWLPLSHTSRSLILNRFQRCPIDEFGTWYAASKGDTRLAVRPDRRIHPTPRCTAARIRATTREMRPEINLRTSIELTPEADLHAKLSVITQGACQKILATD